MYECCVDDQQPLMCHLFCSAIQQMQGQQSLSIETKYFMQSRSAGTSAPFSWAAFSQMGKALLMSSMQRTSRSWAQSWAEARKAKRASSARTISFIKSIIASSPHNHHLSHLFTSQNSHHSPSFQILLPPTNSIQMSPYRSVMCLSQAVLISSSFVWFCIPEDIRNSLTTLKVILE